VTRRDRDHRTPPFRLTGEQIAICHTQAKLGWLEFTLESMHRDWLYDHRPFLGIFRSLDGIGFAQDWEANRHANMLEAYAEWDRVTAPDERSAA
jgi:hypothetical protein